MEQGAELNEVKFTGLFDILGQKPIISGNHASHTIRMQSEYRYME